MWSDRRLLDLFGIEHPILQAPMGSYTRAGLAAAVSEAGGLGGIGTAGWTRALARTEVLKARQFTNKPLNLNFFTHTVGAFDPAADAAWRAALAGYYREQGLTWQPTTSASHQPFDADGCELIEELKPQVVSFHIGLPDAALIARIKRSGAKIISSATTTEEACWLEAHGADAIIAQGADAGGHRGVFLDGDPVAALPRQIGTMALVPLVVDAVRVPVIAAGGIGDARGIAAALMLGASGVQMGTAFLHCPEAPTDPVHRAALTSSPSDGTVVTNIWTGRPARTVVNRAIRELGAISAAAPPFPYAANGMRPLRAGSEATGSADFAPLYAGQAARLGRELPAGELVRTLAAEALDRLGRTSNPKLS